MHPQRDQLLRELLKRAARSRRLPIDLSEIDGGWQIRHLLARIASESYEIDWSPEIAGIIGRARVELARSQQAADLSAPPDWEASNRQIRQVLLEFMTADDRGWQLRSLVDTLLQLYPTPSENRLAADVLLQHDDLWSLAQLNLTGEDKWHVRRSLLAWAGDDASRWARLQIVLLKLDPTARRQGALFKTPCDREEEKRAGGIECVRVSGVRTAVVGVEHLPVLEVGYKPLDRCAK